MLHFTSESQFKHAARHFTVREHCHGEDPLKHTIASFAGSDVGYFCDGYGYLMQTDDDLRAIQLRQT